MGSFLYEFKFTHTNGECSKNCFRIELLRLAVRSCPFNIDLYKADKVAFGLQQHTAFRGFNDDVPHFIRYATGFLASFCDSHSDVLEWTMKRAVHE